MTGNRNSGSLARGVAVAAALVAFGALPSNRAHRLPDEGLGPLFPAVLMVVGAVPAARAQTPAGFEEVWDGVASQFHQRSEEEGIVGASLWFVHADEVIGKELHGFADLESRRHVDDGTIYHWASITKTVTAIAILQLRDRGLLELDDPIVDYVPELRAVHNPFGSMEEITIRQLLSHSAGFRDPTWPWGGNEDWHPYEPTEWAQLVAMMPYTEILFEPGSRYSYSNPGIIFLGRVIERLTGDDYEVYVDKNILKPLEMHRSYYDVTPYHLRDERSNNYTVVDGQTTANGLDFDTGITASNGGLNAPVGDMVKYLSFLAGSCTDDACRNVLPRSSLEEMWQPVLPVELEADDGVAARPDDWSESIGLSFFVYQRGDARMVGHTGSQKSFRGFFYVDLEARTAAIAAFNTVGDPHPNTAAVIDGLCDRLFGEVFPLFRD